MFCTSCGARMIGKFCCCCGKRNRSPLEEFRQEERRSEREFMQGKKGSIRRNHIASAAWYASGNCCLSRFGVTVDSPYCMVAPLYDELHENAKKAERLYDGFLRVAAECGVDL